MGPNPDRGSPSAAGVLERHDRSGKLVRRKRRSCAQTVVPSVADSSRIRLYSEAAYLEEGYAFLAQQVGDRSYHPIAKTGQRSLSPPPADLKRRLGAPDAGHDVIFGATAIPEEAWPEDGRFRLTTDQDRVKSPSAPRATSGDNGAKSCCSPSYIQSLVG